MNSWDKERLRIGDEKVAVEEIRNNAKRERLDLRGGNGEKNARDCRAERKRRRGCGKENAWGDRAEWRQRSPRTRIISILSLNNRIHSCIHTLMVEIVFPQAGCCGRPQTLLRSTAASSPPHPHTYPRPHGSVHPNHQGMAMGMLRPRILPPPPRSFSGVRHDALFDE